MRVENVREEAPPAGVAVLTTANEAAKQAKSGE